MDRFGVACFEIQEILVTPDKGRIPCESDPKAEDCDVGLGKDFDMRADTPVWLRQGREEAQRWRN